jgi:uncharacterized protein YjiS (DUF1127 family)
LQCNERAGGGVVRRERLGILAAILSSAVGGMRAAVTRFAVGVIGAGAGIWIASTEELVRRPAAEDDARPDGPGSPREIRAWWPHPIARGRASTSWCRRANDRRLIASLDDRALRDIGIDRALVDDESTVSFWRRR